MRYPVEGAIVVFDPWIQGAYEDGHVAYVERVHNGTFDITEMGWGSDRESCTRHPRYNLRPGNGVSFILRKPVRSTPTRTPRRTPTPTATQVSNLPGRIVYAVEVPDTSPAHFQIHLTNGTGTEDRVLVDDSYYPETDLSPDGTRIVYAKVGEFGGPDEIWVYDLTSGSSQLLVPRERTGSGMYPEAPYAYGNVRWSPDGRSVYYVRDCFCIDVDSLWRVDLANPANRVRLSDLGNRVSGFSGYFEVSPVTWQLLITDIDPAGGYFGFFLADESGRGREPIPTEHNPRPCPAPFSPDGRAFAFPARVGDFTDIFVKIFGEPGETQVTQGNHYVGCPSWSPNGEWLVFPRYIDPPSNADLWAVSIIDGRLIQITNTPDRSELAPVWGP